jgi:hypothetical protein
MVLRQAASSALCTGPAGLAPAVMAGATTVGTYGAGGGKVLDGCGARTAASGAGHGRQGPRPRSRPIWARSG